jgi:hypothetical protein
LTAALDSTPPPMSSAITVRHIILDMFCKKKMKFYLFAAFQLNHSFGVTFLILGSRLFYCAAHKHQGKINVRNNHTANAENV